jgi:Glycosyl hydrolase family 76
MMPPRRARALALVPLLWTIILSQAVCEPGVPPSAAWDAGSGQVPLRGGNIETWEAEWLEPPFQPTDTQRPLEEHDHALNDHLRWLELASPDTLAVDPRKHSSSPVLLPPDVSPTLQALLSALYVMQDHFFETWRGTWPSAIDWTAAVLGTQVSGALNAVTQSQAYTPRDAPFGNVCENTIAGYFSHVSSFYFGENAFDLRLQANDDMLWVVLEWLEAIRFIRTHSDAHYVEGPVTSSHDSSNSSWYARHFIPAFAHRSRIFWDLAHKGWDTTLCDGGMIWNPDLIPYKNAITNQLYIAASISMYLYFPGDNNGFPFSQSSSNDGAKDRDQHPLPPVEPHDPRYLHAAQVAYDWLMASGMTNVQGLFVDGFHIRGWRPGRHGSNGTGKCDVRNEMVYTYNQGVILTGQRGLWRATGNTTYLDAGHALIANVIKATGWQEDGAHFPGWCGLGRSGVLEEMCDAKGSCSQNGQTFKGIFFHHLAEFCAELEQEGDAEDDAEGGKSGGAQATASSSPVKGRKEIFHPATPAEAAEHALRCGRYAAWITRNARAAAGTRNGAGEFGTWWTVGLDVWGEASHDHTNHDYADSASVDYRNDGLPSDAQWQLDPGTEVHSLPGTQRQSQSKHTPNTATKDANDRGRGRTVETQSGGIAVLKALYARVERGRE